MRGSRPLRMPRFGVGSVFEGAVRENSRVTSLNECVTSLNECVTSFIEGATSLI